MTDHDRANELLLARLQPSQPLTDRAVIHLMPFAIPPEYDGALLAFARAVEAAVIDAANAKANAAWPLMCQKLVATEREACAAIAEGYHIPMCETFADAIAQDIRARGQA